MIKTKQILLQTAELYSSGHTMAVGNDLVHLPTFIKSLTPEFIRRVYTNDELAYCEKFADSTLRYASTWAAKEAVYKAIKQVDETKKLSWRGIEILRTKIQGKPSAVVNKLRYPLEFSLTISHDGDYAWAIAICLYNKEVKI